MLEYVQDCRYYTIINVPFDLIDNATLHSDDSIYFCPVTMYAALPTCLGLRPMMRTTYFVVFSSVMSHLLRFAPEVVNI